MHRQPCADVPVRRSPSRSVWKPWRGLEELQGGIGVVADDVVAGLIANLCLQALRWAVGA